eukprot:1112923-Pyramimonas_sp.AAC.1
MQELAHLRLARTHDTNRNRCPDGPLPPPNLRCCPAGARSIRLVLETPSPEFLPAWAPNSKVSHPGCGSCV